MKTLVIQHFRPVRTRVLGAAVAVVCTVSSACGSSTQPPTAAAESQPVADPSAERAIEEAERSLAVAGGDCEAGCAAVAKIARARLRLCSPRTSACDDAERRDDEARRNVASYCGKCP
jgi:hypothetical protein